MRPRSGALEGKAWARCGTQREKRDILGAFCRELWRFWVEWKLDGSPDRVPAYGPADAGPYAFWGSYAARATGGGGEGTGREAETFPAGRQGEQEPRAVAARGAADAGDYGGGDGGDAEGGAGDGVPDGAPGAGHGYFNGEAGPDGACHGVPACVFDCAGEGDADGDGGGAGMEEAAEAGGEGAERRARARLRRRFCASRRRRSPLRRGGRRRRRRRSGCSW